MNIDASLQSFMDPYINIARATVAKGASDKELVNTVLLTFGGLGLARAVTGKKGTKWILLRRKAGRRFEQGAIA